MGFFIRKSFRAGPIRFNLSKSGIGVSAGVKGARVGVGPRGAYVAGGRGGLYFRETIGGSSARSGNRISSTSVQAPRGTGELFDEFLDTGLTYESPIKKSTLHIKQPPALPEPKSFKATLVIGIIFLLISLLNFSPKNPPIFSIIVTIVFLGTSAYFILYNKDVKQHAELTKQFLEKLFKIVEEGKKPPSTYIPESLSNASSNFKKHYSNKAIRAYIASFCNEVIAEKELETAKMKLEISNDEFLNAKLHVFSNLFDTYLEDGELDVEEEASIKSVAKKLNIPRETIESEMQVISVMSSIREDVNSALSPIETPLPLQKGEICYYRSDAKILKEKTLSTQTISGTKYKKKGFDIEKEGTAYLTNKKIAIVGAGVYTIPISKIVDVVLNIENSIIELSLDNRKTSLYLTLAMAIPFAAKLEKIMQK
ncbi:DUF4236 domain-containing protein [Trichloromonas acetexigens]|jgi:hypothetical protein|uniref:DUF4236 domain-containing protein n=1 Tax=Trichloromonas acetexigens TaxID=38815 RepID=A0A550JKZ0_9BACT|nr:DUF4236 domain-containing protein [Desulfuromonas acetexigens]TRO83884.1 DUF4236 domain-containing protein [Desulfuromonas acetexigens]